MLDYPSPPPLSTDRDLDCWQLVAAAQAGNQSVAAQLYVHYQPMVTRLLYARTRDRSLTEDLCQETFLRALRRIHTVHDLGKDFGAFLVTIARNLVADHFKSSHHRLDRTTAEVPEQPNYDNGPEQAALRNDLAATLWALPGRAALSPPSSAPRSNCGSATDCPVTEAAQSVGCSRRGRSRPEPTAH